MNRLAIVGSRTFRDRSVVEHRVIQAIEERWLIVTGDCPKGPDRWATEVALRSVGLSLADAVRTTDDLILRPAYLLEIHCADWDRLGKSAGPIRNTALVRASHRMIAFWDGKSPGTLDAIKKAVHEGIPIEVVGATRNDRILPGLRDYHD